MRLDSQLAFVPVGSPLSIVAADGVATYSNVIDLLGQGVGQAPANIIGNATLFGADMGVGGIRPEIICAVGTAFTTGNAATLEILLQAAADQGVAGGYQPSTWNTIVGSEAIAAASLTAGQIVFRVPWLPVLGTLRPRYLRMSFAPAASTHFTAGTISFAGVTLIRDDLNQKNAAKNFTVA